MEAGIRFYRQIVAFLIILLAVATGLTAQEVQRLSAAEIADRTRSAVALIVAVDEQGDTIRWGSGFLVERDGTLVTNYHVVEGASALKVKLANNEIYTVVYFVASDPQRDIAILRIPIENAPFIRLAVREELRVGDRVYAIGTPPGLRRNFERWPH